MADKKKGESVGMRIDWLKEEEKRKAKIKAKVDKKIKKVHGDG